ncbi:MAG: diaminopimelate epimerase, partial [Kiritimatiellae bacterium]|nr:diaminopimelate epimerase [Kiritimatiellia bacterium]
MKFGFLKMHGAGNDFVVLADPDARFPVGDPALVRRLCAPHAGLVCEGLLVLRKRGAPAGADLCMVFFNPDGSRAGMCGNGLRCAVFAAGLFGFAAGPAVSVATDAGVL